MSFRRTGSFFIFYLMLQLLLFLQIYGPWKTDHNLVRTAKEDSFLFHGFVIQLNADKVIHISFSGFLDGDDFPSIGNGSLFFRIVLYNPCPDANLTFGYHISCYYFKRFVFRFGFSGFLTDLGFLFLSVDSGWSSPSFKI